MAYFCYMLECRDGSYYCGWTTDLKRRLKVHMNGTGGKYTRSRLPVILVYHEEHCSRSKAMRREWELKQLDHQTKHNLAKAFNNRSIG